MLAGAQRRGMPLQLPLLDLEDQTQLTPADLWSDYQPAIRQASARYPHDVIVVGRLRAQTDGRWRGAWSILDARGAQGFDAPAQTLALIRWIVQLSYRPDLPDQASPAELMESWRRLRRQFLRLWLFRFLG